MHSPRSADDPGESVLINYFSRASPTLFYTLSLHDALPISRSAYPCPVGSWPPPRLDCLRPRRLAPFEGPGTRQSRPGRHEVDRKSTRLNSSHPSNSYAVFCLKKKSRFEWHPPLPIIDTTPG